jgi:gamma-glutamyl:cysteine ligase YbdK (ATP-grasp superfamily)
VTEKPLGLFQGFGIELEYMIVHAHDLSVFPASDQIIRHFSGGYESEIGMGALNWSNELVLHVIELKTDGPAPSLDGLPESFGTDVQKINRFLRSIGGRLMPTAMHPWMDPLKETRLWPHEYSAVYESYNRIFGCSGHGWSNLQSLHINLPFSGDGEFANLHAAVRLILPILPALAASSPLVEGRVTGFLDNRLEFYRNNQKKIPSLTGSVIPEPVYSRSDYQKRILDRLYADIKPYDVLNIMQNEWINSRGAIARFDRNTIEIRMIDVQECPLADLSIAAAVVGALRLLTSGGLSNPEIQRPFPTESLSAILLSVIRNAENTVIDDVDYLRAFGLNPQKPITARDLWVHLEEAMPDGVLSDPWRKPLKTILTRGTLASRILQSLKNDPSRSAIDGVYRELTDCLSEGRLFAP